MNKSLLDTDILSEILKAVDPRVTQNAAAYLAAFGRLTTCAPVVMEIVHGLNRQHRAKQLKQFLTSLSTAEVLPLDRPSAEQAGRISADLEAAGLTIGRIDPMIAGIALHHGLTLVTGNAIHYQRIQALGYGLVLDNWRR